MTRWSNKLDYKKTGPYTVSKIINKNAYKLDLANTIRKHNVCHFSLLNCNTPPTAGQHPSEQQLMVVDDCDRLDWEFYGGFTLLTF